MRKYFINTFIECKDCGSHTFFKEEGFVYCAKCGRRIYKGFPD